MRKGLTIGGALTVAVFALGWLFLAPTQIGGTTTYVVTHGVSMEPKFHTGDLAVLRAQQSYHVGEVVAYRSATLHTVVMHRVVGVGGGTFTFKGDNNSWLDPDHPTKADLLGSLEFQLPQGGRYLDMVHSTYGRIVGGGLIALLLLGGTAGIRRRALRTSRGHGSKHRAGRHRAPSPPSRRVAGRKTREPWPGAGSTIVLPESMTAGAIERVSYPAPVPRHVSSARADETWRRISAKIPRVVYGQLVAVALLLVACLGGELWLLTRPATVATTRTAVVDQTGTFGYSATVPASVVYPSGEVKAGDPIFTQIVHHVDFSFDYAADESMNGTVGLSAALTGPSGWTTPVGAGPVAPVRDGKGHALVSVDLSAVQAALDEFTSVTGVKAASASLVLTPTVSVKGSISGEVIRGAYAAHLTMSAGPSQLVVASSVPSSAGGDGPAGGTNPLVTSSAINAKVPNTGQRTLPVLGHRIAVKTARIVVGAAGVAAISYLFALLIGSRRTGRAEDDVVSALRQYGNRIVDAESIPLDGPIVELTSLAALHSIAERYDRVILHSVRGERHSYVVRDELSWYRYDIRPDHAQHAARRGIRENPGGADAAIIALQPRSNLLDILPGGVGAAAWAGADGYSRAS